MNSEYTLLTDIVNNNLKKSGYEEIIFELEENLYESIHNFPVNKLLSISNDTYFITELFYKGLDRPVDKPTLLNYINKLKNKSVTRIDLIKSIINSQEYKNKSTVLNFDEGVKK